MQRNSSFHSLLNSWCLDRQWRTFYKSHRTNDRSAKVFLRLVGFLGYQLHLQQGLVTSGDVSVWDTPLRSGVPVLYLSCLNLPICMGFLPNENLNLVVPVPSTSLHNRSSISFSALPNRHPTPHPSLQACVSALACLVWFPRRQALCPSKPAAVFSRARRPCSGKPPLSWVGLLTFLGNAPLLGTTFNNPSLEKHCGGGRLLKSKEFRSKSLYCFFKGSQVG